MEEEVTYDFIQAYEAMRHGMVVVPLDAPDVRLLFDEGGQHVVMRNINLPAHSEVIPFMHTGLLDSRYVPETLA